MGTSSKADVRSMVLVEYSRFVTVMNVQEEIFIPISMPHVVSRTHRAIYPKSRQNTWPSTFGQTHTHHDIVKATTTNQVLARGS